MNIVAITACTIGVAHTYIAKEKLIEAAENRGHAIHVETQGNIGIEDELPPETILLCGCHHSGTRISP